MASLPKYTLTFDGKKSNWALENDRTNRVVKTFKTKEVPMRYHARPFLSLLVLVSYLNACTSWQVQSAPTTSVLTKYAGKDVRVTTVGGERIKIQQPTVSGDTVLGRGRDTTTVAVPLQEVREVAVKRTDVARTALLIVGIGAVAFVAASLAICADVCER